jgi:hypothetical protein
MLSNLGTIEFNRKRKKKRPDTTDFIIFLKGVVRPVAYYHMANLHNYKMTDRCQLSSNFQNLVLAQHFKMKLFMSLYVI